MQVASAFLNPLRFFVPVLMMVPEYNKADIKLY